MAITLLNQRVKPERAPYVKRNYRAIVSRFLASDMEMAHVTRVENPFGVVGGLRYACKHDNELRGLAKVVTRNGHIYLFRENLEFHPQRTRPAVQRVMAANA